MGGRQERAFLPPRVSPPAGANGEEASLMPHGRNWVMGEQLAQVDNRDPFAVPVWRSPVYRTPEPVIMVVQLVRLIWRVLWFALTHPGVDAMAALVVVTWLGLSWPGVAGLTAIAVVGLAGLRVLQPVWFASTHGQSAGVAGGGERSVIWWLQRALLLASAGGWVQLWALDPKRMELSFGRALFHRYACQADAMVELLEAAVAQLHDRAGQFGGKTRTFTPSVAFTFVVVLVDELAFLTAYQPERDLRKRAEAAIATLTSQGRSVGVCVVGALQDPREDVISLRNLFSTRIALRLDESDQVDMVLGDGARDRSALADQISPLPYIGAGVGYVRLEASPDPVRVRAAYVTDADILALASVCPPCAERARILRAAQCREGWHLDHEPVIDPDPATEEQRDLITDRAETQEGRDLLAGEGLDTGELDERIGELDQEITDS